MIELEGARMQPLDLHGLRTYSLEDRPSKVFTEDLGRPVGPDASLGDWFDSLPKQLAANQLRRLRDHCCRIIESDGSIVVALGGHVIKTGCAPYLIDWVQRGWVKAIVMNGSAAIHDFELALAGKTSEDVASQLPEGRFGMAQETADAFAISAQRGAQIDRGLGLALGQYIDELNHAPYRGNSLVYAAWKAGIPCTIHVALGTDIVHMHPHVSGASLGESSMIDFRILCRVVMNMKNGLWLNLGSAVVLPEVFLKAVSVARNFGANLDGLITANFDKEAKYRTNVNVLNRPSSEGIEIIGHHELLIPMFHAALAAKMAQSTSNTTKSETTVLRHAA
jgi:hypothetical protein